MIELRGYQAAACAKIATSLAAGARVLAVSPTGSGKTVIGAAVVMRSPAQRVLWVAHRIELLRQATAALRESGIPAESLGILTGPEKANLDARVMVASVDTLRARDAPTVDLIVVDEAHRVAANGYQKILAANPNAAVLGLTATPWRLDGRGLGATFGEMLQVASQAELIVSGYLAMPVTYGVPREIAEGMTRGVSRSAGDFAQGQLGRAMMKGTLMGDVVSECARLAPGERTIVFAASREHGRALASRFVEAGRAAAYLDGETPEAERSAILAGLESGAVEVAVNVDVLTEGFDCSAVKCVVLARPTRSLTRYLQYTGRAARPFDGKRALILDHAGNVYRHGLPQIDREWTLDDRPKGEGGGAPVRHCPECSAINAASARECGECGATFPPSEREMAEEAAELERIAATEAERARVRAALTKVAAVHCLDAAWVDRRVAELLT